MFKKYYEKYKELRANPKLKPFISLGFWFIFLIIVVIFIKSNTSEVKQNKEVKTIDNYEFTYLDNKTFIFGEVYDNKIKFTLNNNLYYYNGTDIYLINNQTKTLVNFDLGILKINKTMIDNLTSNLNYSIVDNGKQYLVPLSNFINLYEYDTDVDLTKAMNLNIIILVYDDMYKLDLSNYYGFKGIENKGIITINIYNKTDNFSETYEKLGGVK